MKNITDLIKLNLREMNEILESGVGTCRVIISDNDPWFDELNSMGYYKKL